jgi:hypothetical protein
VRVALVGKDRAAVRTALEAEPGVELIGPPGAIAGPDGGEIPRLAAALRAFESLFEAERVERVVLTDASNHSLAALLVATKMLVPVGAVATPSPGGEREDGRSSINARLIEHLADAALADEAVTGWLREPQQPSQAAAEH